jgi:lysine 2,3-aminomutase
MKAATKQTLRSAADLVDAQLAGGDRLDALQKVAERYAVAITPAIAGLIDPSDLHDPIARQFVPDAREFDERPEENGDPIGDDAHSPVEGIVHRYPDRVLLKLVNACAVYCRFCFRREMVGPGRGGLDPAALKNALDYIRRCRQIWEVILTGGDPLVLSARRLDDVVKELTAIDHVKVLRVHTRVPVAAPERVSAAMVRALRTAKAAFVVVHVNHPRELTAAARVACARLIDAGIPVLSQSVLLRGVNDDVETLGALMRALVECRRSGFAAGPARPLFGPVPAGLCPRYSRRLRQIADRAGLLERGLFGGRGFQRPTTLLSAATVTHRSKNSS